MGMSTDCLESKLLCTWALEVSSKAGASVTSTVVLTVPTANAMFTDTVRFSVNSTPAVVEVANPFAVADTS